MNKTTVSIIIILSVCAMHASDGSCRGLRNISTDPASGWWRYDDFVFVVPEVSGTTDLHRAAKNGDIDSVRKLLDQDTADVNVQNDDGDTPLHYAAEHGRVDVVRELLARRANVKICNSTKNTPLHCAAALGNEDIACELLAHGADGKAQCGGDFTPAKLAKLYGHNDLAQLLYNWNDFLEIKGAAEAELD